MKKESVHGPSMDEVNQLLQVFGLSSSCRAAESISEGLLHQTYKITTADQHAYILQRFNTSVFEKPEEVASNAHKINLVFQSDEHALKLYTTIRDSIFYEQDGQFFRMFNFIENSVAHRHPKNEHMAYEMMQGFADFSFRLRIYEPADFFMVLPHFHDLEFRLKNLQAAQENAIDNRKIFAHQLDHRIQIIWEYLMPLLRAELPQHIIHNDCKSTNVLMDTAQEKWKTVIDWDTCMAGYLYYDFGDAARSMCFEQDEDDERLQDLEVNTDYFDALSAAFIGRWRDEMDASECMSLHLSAAYMSLIMCVRFFTDYLLGDLYYKLQYPNQNWNRANNQLVRAERFVQLDAQLKNSIKKA